MKYANSIRAHLRKGKPRALRGIERIVAACQTGHQSPRQKPLEPIVAAMLADGHKAALSAMAVLRDKPNLFEQFIVLCEEAGPLS